ncbi:sensor histidine kinase [Pseudalkalibacillus sp. R45]|uniref:sensor histidine kinase n=1 Tax=Pseudalkalibacillus sp. R45 TaxID=3457433 RepID=UPI003FCE670B
MKFISLRSKLIIAFVVFILFPILITSFLGYKGIEHILREQIEASTADRLHQVNLNIEKKLKSMMYASNSIVLDEDIRSILQHPFESERERLDIRKKLDEKYLEISTTILTENVNLTIIDNHGNIYTNWGNSPDSFQDILGSEWYSKTLDQDGFMVWSLNQENYIHPKRDKFVTVSRVIKNKSLSEKIGVMIISEPIENYQEILKVRTNISNSMGFIVDENGRVLGNQEQDIEELYKFIQPSLKREIDTFNLEVNGEKAIVSTYSLPLTGWKVLQVVPHKGVFEELTTIRDTVMTILIVSMIIFIAIIILFSSMLTRPLRDLRDSMKQVEEGNLEISCTVYTRDEVGLLGKSFNKMISQMKENINREISLEKNKEKAKLEALQAQINPHFLYNTLNTIRWMAVMAGTKNITKMLMSLGRLLDMSIHRGQEEITLEEELVNVRSFLTIQKYRFGDSIQIKESIDNNHLKYAIPKLSLQPLVENIYNHGLFLDGGTLEIRTTVDGISLVIDVIDNGKNMDQEKANEIMSKINKEKHDGLSGIGLKNVHQRIQMMYGNEFGLTIMRNDLEEKTYVSMKLPVKQLLNQEDVTGGEMNR